MAKCGTLLLQIGDVAKLNVKKNEIFETEYTEKQDESDDLINLSGNLKLTDGPSTTNENFIFIPKLIDIESLSDSSNGFLDVKHVDIKKEMSLVEEKLPDDPSVNFRICGTNPTLTADNDSKLESTILQNNSPVCGVDDSVSSSVTPSKNENDNGFLFSESDSKQVNSGAIDVEWRIRYRQFLACMLSEPDLMAHFEKPFDLKCAMKKYRTDVEFKPSPISP